MSESNKVESTLFSLFEHLQHDFLKFLKALCTLRGRNGKNIKDVKDLYAVGAAESGMFTHIGGGDASALKLIITTDRAVVVVDRTIEIQAPGIELLIRELCSVFVGKGQVQLSIYWLGGRTTSNEQV